MSGQLDNFRNSIEEADYSQIYLVQMYPLLEASSGQEQYYIARSDGSIFSHLLFTCWRGKSYIAMQEILVIEN